MQTRGSRPHGKIRRVSAGRRRGAERAAGSRGSYGLRMRKPAAIPAFPDYLREAIPRMGYQTPTDFARAADISPSVVLRWLKGETRPLVPLLERVAPFLGAKLSTLVRIAYPEIDEGLPIEEAPELHPLVAELQRRLGPQSTLSSGEQEMLTRIVDSVLAPYRSRPTPKAS